MSEITPPNYGHPTEPKTSALAIWSLVLGILSLVCFSIFAAIPGVICGHMSIGRINRSGGALQGKGMAIAGLVTGYLGLAWAIIFIPMMIAIAIPNFVRAREMAMTSVCVNNIHEIQAAKQQWALQMHKQPTDVPTVADITPYLRNKQMPICVAGGSYTLNAVADEPACSIPKHKDKATQ